MVGLDSLAPRKAGKALRTSRRGPDMKKTFAILAAAVMLLGASTGIRLSAVEVAGNGDADIFAGTLLYAGHGDGDLMGGS